MVTREETPGSLMSLLKQRTRWNQGFLQVYRKKDWKQLPTPGQRMLARYTLMTPFLQAFTGVIIPLNVGIALFLDVSVTIAFITFLPLVTAMVTFVFEVVGLHDFGKQYGLRVRLTHYLKLVVGGPFYQVLLAGRGDPCRLARAAGTQRLGADQSCRRASHPRGRPRVTSTLPVVTTDQRTAVPTQPNDAPDTDERAGHKRAGHKQPRHKRANGERGPGTPDEADGRTGGNRRLTVRPVVRFRGSRPDLLLCGVLLVAILLVQGWNIQHYPTLSDDEGTYLAQAWAVQEGNGLAHYTYWYDHPPLGWMQIAFLTWLPSLLSPESMTVAPMRFAMLLVSAASAVFLYVLARRLWLPRWAAGLAMVLFGLSPLSVVLQREIFLDNIAVMWMLLAFCLAASPHRHLWHHFAAGIAAAVGVLTKETMLVILPAAAGDDVAVQPP